MNAHVNTFIDLFIISDNVVIIVRYLAAQRPLGLLSLFLFLQCCHSQTSFHKLVGGGVDEKYVGM